MDDGFRGALTGGVIMIILGTVGLAVGTGVLGWVALVLGVAGVGVVVAMRRGWITPRTRALRADPPAARPGPPAPDNTAVRPVPQLSGPGRERVAGIVAELHAAGVLVPDAPDPAHLYESAADQGEPVTVETVLGALHEASYYHPGFRPESCAANLVFHGTQVEQGRDYLREQIDDLVRLSRWALAVEVAGVEQEYVDGSRQVPTRIRWTVNGAAQTLAYAGAAKYLSTVIHVTLARAMSGAPRRLAALWTDQGMWVTTLPESGVESLNAALGTTSWDWVADQEPMAAGDVT